MKEAVKWGLNEIRVNPEMDRQIGGVVVAVSASLELGHEDTQRDTGRSCG